MIDFKIIGDYELNQCVEVDNIIKTYWVAVNKNDTDNTDCYIYPVRSIDDLEAIPVPVNLNGNPRIRYKDNDTEYVLYNLSDAFKELELNYDDRFLIGFVPNKYLSGSNRFIKQFEFGSGGTIVSVPPSQDTSSTLGPIYFSIALTIKVLENISTGSYGEIFKTLVGGQIINSELRLINGYDDGIVLDKDCYTVSYTSRLYSGSSTVNNAGNNQVFEVYSDVEDDTVSWYESSTSQVGTGTYNAEINYITGIGKHYGILGFAGQCYPSSSNVSCIPLVCVNRKLRYVITIVDTESTSVVEQDKFLVYFMYTDTLNTLISPLNIDIDYHIELYDKDYNTISKNHYSDRLSNGTEDNNPGRSFDWNGATYAKVVIDKVTSPDLTDNVILGYKHKFKWAQKKSEAPEFYWHSSDPVSNQDTTYESNDIILYHSSSDTLSIGGLSNQTIPSGGIKLDWDLTKSTNLEGYASDDNAGSTDPRNKFIFYRITKNIINNSTALYWGVIPFTSEYTKMLPSTGLSGDKYYINLFYEQNYIVFDGSFSTSDSSSIYPNINISMFSPVTNSAAGITITVKVRQYDSSGNLINTTDRSAVCQNSSSVTLGAVDWVENAVTAKVVYESNGSLDNIYSKYRLYGYPSDLTTAIKRPSLGAYQVKVPSWSVAYGRFLLGYSSISSGDTSPSNLLNAYLYQLSVNGNSVNGAIGSDEVGKYIYMGYSRINTTAPLTAYVRYRTNDNGMYSSWSSWINIANSDINSTRYVKIFQLTEDMSTKIIEIQMSDSKSVSDDF